MTAPADLVQVPAPQVGQQIQRTGFGTTEVQNLGETSSTALATQARAIIESAYVMAIRYPRDMEQARVKLLHACRRPLFAYAATYAKPVGMQLNEKTGEWEEKIAEGLSIRFAEEAARNMRNLDIDSYSLYDDNAKKIVKFVVTDLETNVKWSKTVTIVKTTERRKLKKNQVALATRVNSYGDLVYIVDATADEIAKREGAEASKGLRDGILKNLPADIKEECFAVAKATAADTAAKDPDGERKRVFDGFAALGVEPANLKEYLGHDLGILTPAELARLRQLYVGIKEGEVTWAEVMEQRGEAAKPPAAKPAAGPAGVSNIEKATTAAKAKREATKPPAAPAAKPAAPGGLDIVGPGELDNLRSKVAKLAADATLSNEEVCAWFEKDELAELGATELASAVTRIEAMLREPGSEG